MAERVELLDEEGEPVLPNSAGSRASARKRRAPSPQFPATDRAIRLATLDDVAAETARVYRAAARGEINPRAACQLAFLLSTHAQRLEAVVLERRIAALEVLAAPDAASAIGYGGDDDEA